MFQMFNLSSLVGFYQVHCAHRTCELLSCIRSKPTTHTPWYVAELQVDDLKEIGDLELYIQQSTVILMFLSKCEPQKHETRCP